MDVTMKKLIKIIIIFFAISGIILRKALLISST